MFARRLLSIMCLCLLGCAGGEQPRVAVAGRVTYRGYGVRGGVIAFTPDKERGSQGLDGKANLTSDGSFTMPDGGLPPGWYRITIASLEVGLPARYRDPELGNLAREVTAGNANRFDIVLED